MGRKPNVRLPFRVENHVFQKKFQSNEVLIDTFYGNALNELKKYQSILEEVESFSLYNTKPNSLYNDIKNQPERKTPGIQLQNFATFLCAIFMNGARFSGNEKLKIERRNIAVLIHWLDLAPLSNLDENGRLLRIYNKLLLELTKTNKSLGLVQFNENWLLQIDGHIVTPSKRQLRKEYKTILLEIEGKKAPSRNKHFIATGVIFSTILIAVIVWLTVFNNNSDDRKFSEKQIKHKNIETSKEIKNKFVEELNKLKKEKRWAEIEKIATSNLRNVHNRDIALVFLAEAEMFKPIKNNPPAFYVFQIDPNFIVYDNYLVILVRYYVDVLKKNGDRAMFRKKMEELFEHMISRGLTDKPVYFFCKFQYAIEDNMQYPFQIVNADNARYLLSDGYNELKATFSDVYNFDLFMPEIRFNMNPQQVTRYLYEEKPSYPGYKMSQLQATIYYLLASMSIMDLSEDGEWRDRYSDFKLKVDSNIVIEGMNNLGFQDVERKLFMGW